MRLEGENQLTPATWEEALFVVARKVRLLLCRQAGTLLLLRRLLLCVQLVMLTLQSCHGLCVSVCGSKESIEAQATMIVHCHGNCRVHTLLLYNVFHIILPFLHVQLRGLAEEGPQDTPRVCAVAGPLADVESMVCLKDLLNRLGSEELHTEAGSPVTGQVTDLRSSYIMNSGIAGIEVRPLRWWAIFRVL